MARAIINFREERDTSQKISATFAFIRQNYQVLVQCLLWYVVPFALLAGIFSGIYLSRRLPVSPEENEARYRTWGEYDFFNSITSFNYLISVFFSFVSYVMISLIICVYMVQYMDQQGKVKAQEVGQEVRSYFLPVFYASFGILLMCCLGYVLLVVPGIYLTIAFSMFVIIMVREELGFIETIERCLYLIKDNWWSTLGFLLLIGIIQGMIGMVAALPVFLIEILKHFQVPGTSHPLLTIAATSLASVAGIFLYIISFTGIVFQYFHLVEVRDGVGLLEQVALIGRPPVLDYSDEDAH
jgi:hypothetical protein